MTVVPAFYQTRWFLVLVSLAVMGAIAAAWRVRVRQLQRAQAIQQAFSAELIASQERERKRIATELHDGLGQNLLIIRNHALLHAMRHPGSEANAPLTEVSELVSHTIDEVRAIAWNLRPSHLDQLGLRTALIAMIEKVGGAGQLVLEHDIDVCDDLLPSDQEIIVYRIVQECVTNVVKHARATRAMVALTRDEASLVIGVRDNGKGFELVPVSASSYASGGFGLTGIAERVRMLGGTHTITSAAGEGTAVVIRLPVRPGQEVSAHA